MAVKEYTDTEVCLKCVDENEILYDETGKYVEEISSTLLDCSEKHYHDILRNLTGCRDIVTMSLKQRIIMNGSRVRFYAKNDIAGLQKQIADINLPKECKDFLRDISNQGFKILKENHFFDHLVEFDIEQTAKICIFGGKAKMMSRPDMLAMMDKLPQKVKPKILSKRGCKNPNTASTGHPISEERSEILVKEKNMKSLGKVVITVAVTARNYISLTDIFRQFLFKYIHKIPSFFLLVFHIGPLVEKQKVVLYEYKPPTELINFFQSNETTSLSQDKTSKQPDNDQFVVSQTVHKSNMFGPSGTLVEESHDLDVSKLEAELRRVKGQHLQQMTPLRDYFRYIVYDCPGVKDHRKDNKARYDRYMAKCEKKRDLKKSKAIKEEEETNDPESTARTNIAEFGSILND